jgi:hypothetical protein
MMRKDPYLGASDVTQLRAGNQRMAGGLIDALPAFLQVFRPHSPADAACLDRRRQRVPTPNCEERHYGVKASGIFPR